MTAYVPILLLFTVALVLVGDDYQGGRVAYVLQAGDPGYSPTVLHGLIAATAFYAGIEYWQKVFAIGPKNPTPEKMIPYECGSESTGARFVKPSVKFYLTAILFVVFDIEAVFIYPWAIQFRGLGWTGFATMGSFIALLVVGLVYVWKKGALEWEK